MNTMPLAQPQISFIVPVYNSAKYLAKCLESILAQSIEKEIICIDDGSTDNSLEILLNYARQYSFISVVYSNSNKGQSNARNRGLDLARGEYIYFVDSDDLLVNNYFSPILQAFKDVHCDVIKLQTYIKYDDKYAKRIPFSNLSSNGEAPILTMRQFLENLNRGHWMPAICWSLIRRSFLEKHQLRFMEGIKTEDQLFYLQLLTVDLEAKIAELDLFTYIYVRHQNTTTTTKANSQYLFDHFTMGKYILDWISKYQNEAFYPCLIFILKSLYINAHQYFKTFSAEEEQKYQALFTPELLEFIQNENI